MVMKAAASSPATKRLIARMKPAPLIVACDTLIFRAARSHSGEKDVNKCIERDRDLRVSGRARNRLRQADFRRALVGNANAVAPALLGMVERLVGAAHKVGKASSPERAATPKLAVILTSRGRPSMARRKRRCAQLPRAAARRRIGQRQQDREFLAAQPSGNAARAAGGLQPGGEIGDDPVAGGMAVLSLSALKWSRSAITSATGSFAGAHRSSSAAASPRSRAG